MQLHQPTVAVITSTIGRQALSHAIESVIAQSYPCTHYVFVDGEQYANKAKQILQNYPNVVVTYLPMNTGANGWVNSTINAIAPFLVKEDIVCYLDDDNWYEPHHVENLVEVIKSGADYAYSLRNFYGMEREFICRDDMESLGNWKLTMNDSIYLKNGDAPMVEIYLTGFSYHIDTNCYAFPRDLAQKLAHAWNTGLYNDRNVLAALKHFNIEGVGSGRYTVNYCVDLKKMFMPISNHLYENYSETEAKEELNGLIRSLCQKNIEDHNGRPWAKE